MDQQHEYRPRNTRPKLGLKPKAKRWSHQDELEALKGKEIEFCLVYAPASWVRARLLNADQFTLQIQSVHNKSIMTYNKSALVGYRAV